MVWYGVLSYMPMNGDASCKVEAFVALLHCCMAIKLEAYTSTTFRICGWPVCDHTVAGIRIFQRYILLSSFIFILLV